MTIIYAADIVGAHPDNLLLDSGPALNAAFAGASRGDTVDFGKHDYLYKSVAGKFAGGITFRNGNLHRLGAASGGIDDDAFQNTTRTRGLPMSGRIPMRQYSESGFEPTLSYSTIHTPILPGSVAGTSDGTESGVFVDDGNGYLNSGDPAFDPIGTVNYETGVITTTSSCSIHSVSYSVSIVTSMPLALAADLSLEAGDMSLLPSQYQFVATMVGCYFTIDDEIVLIYGDVTSTSIPIARGQRGTTTASHSLGATVTPLPVDTGMVFENINLFCNGQTYTDPYTSPIPGQWNMGFALIGGSATFTNCHLYDSPAFGWLLANLTGTTTFNGSSASDLFWGSDTHGYDDKLHIWGGSDPDAIVIINDFYIGTHNTDDCIGINIGELEPPAEDFGNYMLIQNASCGDLGSVIFNRLVTRNNNSNSEVNHMRIIGRGNCQLGKLEVNDWTVESSNRILHIDLGGGTVNEVTIRGMRWAGESGGNIRIYNGTVTALNIVDFTHADDLVTNYAGEGSPTGWIELGIGGSSATIGTLTMTNSPIANTSHTATLLTIAEGSSVNNLVLNGSPCDHIAADTNVPGTVTINPSDEAATMRTTTQADELALVNTDPNKAKILLGQSIAMTAGDVAGTAAGGGTVDEDNDGLGL